MPEKLLSNMEDRHFYNRKELAKGKALLQLKLKMSLPLPLLATTKSKNKALSARQTKNTLLPVYTSERILLLKLL